MPEGEEKVNSKDHASDDGDNPKGKTLLTVLVVPVISGAVEDNGQRSCS